MTAAPFEMSRILVVDDDDQDVQMMRRLLRDDGLDHVLGVSDPATALVLTTDWHPDLVILDLRMPPIGGVAFLRAGARDGVGRRLPPDPRGHR